MRWLKTHQKQGNTGLKSIFPCFLLFPEPSQLFPVFTGKKRASAKKMKWRMAQNVWISNFLIFCYKNREEL